VANFQTSRVSGTLNAAVAIAADGGGAITSNSSAAAQWAANGGYQPEAGSKAGAYTRPPLSST